MEKFNSKHYGKRNLIMGKFNAEAYEYLLLKKKIQPLNTGKVTRGVYCKITRRRPYNAGRLLFKQTSFTDSHFTRDLLKATKNL
jgi:hypothetical protein